ncbi:MAG: HNH endonuclease [Bacteroidales bacterium]|nr:HNH endonuclease [Bacteroidales bacterium]
MPTIYKPKRRQERTGDNYYQERRKIYNSERWQRLRTWKLANNPLCEMCLKKGIITPTEDIHHIVSFMTTTDRLERYRLAYDMDNLMSLCKRCHQELHNKKDKA